MTVRWLTRTIGLFGTPLAWLAQMNASDIVASHACYPHAVPLAGLVAGWLYTALSGISALAFVAGSFSFWLAWKAWRCLNHAAPNAERHAAEVGEGRVRFLALSGVMSGGMFMVAIILTACNIVLVSPC